MLLLSRVCCDDDQARRIVVIFNRKLPALKEVVAYIIDILLLMA